MNCARLAQVIDAYLDGELDRATGDEIGRHLEQCPACTARRNEREVLVRRLRAEAPYFAAPDALKLAVSRSLARQIAPTRVRARPSWLQAGALAVVAALVSAIAGYWSALPLPDAPQREQVVASHVASLAEARRLTHVTSPTGTW